MGRSNLYVPVGHWPSRKLLFPRENDSKHYTVSGNPGMGKSTMFMHFLERIEEAGEVAIVVGDPKAEYFKRFYRPGRGDFAFDPANDECCYWALEEEAKDRARAASWGLSFIPDPPGQDENFFPKNSRMALEGLISRHNIWNAPEDPATCENLARWIGNAETDLMRRLTKIPGVKSAFTKDSPNQLNGLTGTMAPLVPGFGMMPRLSECRRKFTVAEWSQKRDGSWIFFTSHPDTHDATGQVQTAVVDNLLRAVEKRVEGAPRIWILCDELSIIKRLMRLKKAAAMLRESGNPLVLGFQNSAQLDDIYGVHGTKAILGMAYTQVAFASTDPEIQKHIEQQFGYSVVERLTENKPLHVFFGSSHSRSASVSSQQLENIPVVSATKIGSLAPYWFYVKQGDRVVKARIKKNTRPVIHQYIERIIPELTEPEVTGADDEPAEEAERECVPVDGEEEVVVPVPVDDAPVNPIRPQHSRRSSAPDVTLTDLMEEPEDEIQEVPVD